MYHVVTHKNPDPPDSAETPEPDEAKTDDAPDEEGSDAEPKKERVLHTRIPAVLEAELKSAARSLRVPVSNLVRAILEDAVAIADRATGKVEDRLTRAAKSMHDERSRMRERVAKPDPLKDVAAYQPVTMAADGECAKCGGKLEEGDSASLAITARPGPPRFVCSDCIALRGA